MTVFTKHLKVYQEVIKSYYIEIFQEVGFSMVNLSNDQFWEIFIVTKIEVRLIV